MWHYLPPGGTPRRRVGAFECWREEPADLPEEELVCPGAPEPVAVQDWDADRLAGRGRSPAQPGA